MEDRKEVDGPFFEDLTVGLTITDAPSVTLTEGLATLHGAIVGDRLRLPLDHHLSRVVTGGAIASPSLVWDVAIGQSTLMTRRVIANLFYRGLAFQRFPVLGDTLYSTTEIVALRQNRPRPGRAATGLGVMRMRTVDQAGRAVLDFRRCAMFPLRDPSRQTGHDAEFADDAGEVDPEALRLPIANWNMARFRETVPGASRDTLTPGTTWEIVAGDVVSLAPELARLTLNVAMVHHDAGPEGRLVYGGHTIGIAAGQAIRALPNLVTIVAWHSCDHLAPVREGDTLHSTLELERCEPPLQGDGRLVHLRSRVRARRGDHESNVLDWRFVGVMA
jgi:acyl dehydratase